MRELADSDDDEIAPEYVRGRADPMAESAEEPDYYYAAILCLPNPESRSGWSFHGVKRRVSPGDQPPRRLGFRP